MCNLLLDFSLSHYIMHPFPFQTAVPEAPPTAAAPTAAPTPVLPMKEEAFGLVRPPADSSATCLAGTPAMAATPSISNPGAPGAAAISAPTLATAPAGSLVGAPEVPAAGAAMVDLPLVVVVVVVVLGHPPPALAHAQPLGLGEQRGVELTWFVCFVWGWKNWLLL